MVKYTNTAVIVDFALLYLCFQHCSGRPRPYEASTPVDRWSPISQQVENLASRDRHSTGLSIPVSRGGNVFNGQINESQYERMWAGHDLHSSFSDLLEAMGGSSHDWFSQAPQPPVNHWYHTPVSSLPSESPWTLFWMPGSLPLVTFEETEPSPAPYFQVMIPSRAPTGTRKSKTTIRLPRG
jgi:hypothetical protein